MQAVTALRYVVFVAFVVSLGLLTIQALGTLRFGRRRLYSEARGSRWNGVAYAFGRGMMPWEKESAAKHLPTYIAGMSYHAGIFSAVFYALSLAVSVRLGPAPSLVLQILMAAGFLAGAGLLVKRTIKPEIRHISCPDDYAANLITDIFILSGLLAVRFEALETVFLLAAAVTFLYMPLGKIRHCFFFFYSRFLFGSYFGRRGVLPRRRPDKAEAQP